MPRPSRWLLGIISLGLVAMSGPVHADDAALQQQISTLKSQDSAIHAQLASDQAKLSQAQSTAQTLQQQVQSLGHTVSSSQQGIITLQNQIEQIQSDAKTKIDAAQSKIVTLYNDASQVGDQITQLRQQESTTKTAEQNDKNQLVTLKQDLHDTQVSAQSSIRAVYVLEQSDPLAILLQSRSFTDMLGRIALVDSIFTHDRQLAHIITTKQQAIQQETVAIQNKEVELANLDAQYQQQYNQLQQDETSEKTLVQQFQQMEQQQQATLESEQAKLASAERDARAAAQRDGGPYATALSNVITLQDQITSEKNQITNIENQISHDEELLNSGVPSGSGYTFSRWPLQGTITQPFGPSSLYFEPSYIYNGVYYPHFHLGIDIAAPFDAPIYAPAAGTIVVAGYNVPGYDGFGQVVVEQFTSHLMCIFGHTDNTAGLPAYVGEQVSAGQVLAYEGSTGWSTGPHLHFQCEIDGVPRNPMIFLPPY